MITERTPSEKVAYCDGFKEAIRWFGLRLPDEERYVNQIKEARNVHTGMLATLDPPKQAAPNDHWCIGCTASAVLGLRRAKMMRGEAYGCGWHEMGNGEWQWNAWGPTGSLIGMSPSRVEAEGEAIDAMENLVELTPIYYEPPLSNAGPIMEA